MFTFVTVLRMIIKTYCGSSSVGRASASQAEGHEFESRLPLDWKLSTYGYRECFFYVLPNFLISFIGVLADQSENSVGMLNLSRQFA